MVSERWGRSVLTVVVIGVVLAGCAAASTQPSSTVVPVSPSPTVVAEPPSPTPAPTEPFALRAGALPAGQYTTTAFDPTLRFTIEAGWRGLFPDDEDEVALEGPGAAFFAITRVSEVVDPTTFGRVAVPDDLIAWLTSHPALTASVPEPLTIAGVAGRWVDVTVTDGSELEVFAYPTGNMRIAAGMTFRCHILPLDGPDLTIVLGAPKGGFAEASATIQSVLDSLVIEAGR